MRFPLQVKSTIELTQSCINESKLFLIEEIVGMGASCIVYTANFFDAEKNRYRVRLKEYNPYDIVLGRKDDGTLLIEQNCEKFEKGLKRFENAYRQQINFRMDNSVVNSISEIQGVYEGLGTKYIIESYFDGVAYSNYADGGLNECLKIARATTKALNEIHKKGFLHLDVKPDNIFKLSGVSDFVVLFDFDSVIAKSDLELSERYLSYSQDWAAPELIRLDRANINESTDIYSIGAIVFFKVFHRLPALRDRMNSESWEYNFQDEFLKNIDDSIVDKLNMFFRKTIASSGKKRYSNCEELLSALDELISLTSDSRRYIISRDVICSKPFVGRDADMISIDNFIDKDGYVFLCGVGGIGKSEVVKKYCCEKKEKYKKIVFLYYENSIAETLASDKMLTIHGVKKFSDEDILEYYERKLSILKEIVAENTLIVIDNLDTYEDEYLKDFLSLNCKKVITSRENPSELGLNSHTITELSEDEIVSVFMEHWGHVQSTNSEKEKIKYIINKVNKHTLTVELFAKQINASFLSLDDAVRIVDKICNNQETNEKILYFKDEQLYKNSIKDILVEIFNINVLSGKQKTILYNLSTVSVLGIFFDLYRKCFSDFCVDDINNLERMGWVSVNREDRIISIHPVISDMLLSQMDNDRVNELCRIIYLYDGNSYDESNLIFNIANKLLIISDKLDVDNRAKALSIIALYYYNKGQFYKAKAIYEEALQHSPEMNIAIIIKKSLAACMQNIEMYDSALDLYNIVMAFCKENQEDKALLSVYNDLSCLYDKIQDEDKAIFYAKLELELAIQIDDKLAIIEALQNEALAYINVHDYHMAEEILLNAMEVIEESDILKQHMFPYFYNIIGFLYYRMDETEKAEKYALISLEQKKALYGVESRTVIKSMINYARVLYDKEEFTQALDITEEAYRLYISVNSIVLSTDILIFEALSSLYIKIDKYDLAEKYINKGIDLYLNYNEEKREDYYLMLRTKGQVFQCTNRIEKAIECFAEMNEFYNKHDANYDREKCISSIYLAKCYENVGNKDEYNRYYDYAYALAKKNGHIEWVTDYE